MMKFESMARFAGLIALTGLSACATEAPTIDLSEVYEAAAARSVERPPLVALPGTMGSVLRDSESGAMLWGGPDQVAADPSDPDTLRLLALPIGPLDAPLSEQRDSVEAAGVFDAANIKLLGVIPVSQDFYGGGKTLLAAGGYIAGQVAGREEDSPSAQRRDRAATPQPLSVEASDALLRLSYDWRRDIVETAALIKDTLDAERERRENPEARFDLMAHSMGALALRYFLRYGDAPLPDDGEPPPITWAGASYVDAVILAAPPNAGSVLAFERLVNGVDLGRFVPSFPPLLVGTHPSTYQLMPRARHGRVRMQGDEAALDIYDPDLWVGMKWGLADPAADDMLALLLPELETPEARRKRALAHQARLLRRAERLHEALDRPATPPEDLDVYLVIGGGYRTPALAEVEAETGAVTIADYGEGDGLVLRESALLDERATEEGVKTTRLWSTANYRSVLLLPEEHVEVLKSPVFGDHLLFWLLESPRAKELRNPQRVLAGGARVNRVGPTRRISFEVPRNER